VRSGDLGGQIIDPCEHRTPKHQNVKCDELLQFYRWNDSCILSSAMPRIYHRKYSHVSLKKRLQPYICVKVSAWL
jgi:hypothetical protein